MKSLKGKNELRPTHPGEILKEHFMKLVDDNPDLSLDMVRQIDQGRQELLSGHATKYEFD